MMNVLHLYNSTQTYTNTVFEHIAGFFKYSKYRSFFCHQDQFLNFDVDLSRFDAVVIHYTIRLPFDQVSDSTAKALEQYTGLKVLFIQDEYDYTYRAWYWIKRLGIQLVFTVVPPGSVHRVYPPEEFPDVRFVSNLTGYVPDGLSRRIEHLPPSKRKLVIGYRGRPLPARYGRLGQEKTMIGQLVKQYCDSKGINNDIAWTDEARIYGSKWYKFMVSCRAMLGSESGNNVFDWEGVLDGSIERYRDDHPDATDEDIYKALVAPAEVPGLMNQVSPRIFEAIAARTALVLFEGNYSGVIVPYLHFIPLKKDGSNLDEIFALLEDGKYVDELTERAYQHVIAPGRYSYKAFVSMVDEQIAQAIEVLGLKKSSQIPISRLPLTKKPMRPVPQRPPKLLMHKIWRKLPESVKVQLRPRLKMLLRKG